MAALAATASTVREETLRPLTARRRSRRRWPRGLAPLAAALAAVLVIAGVEIGTRQLAGPPPRAAAPRAAPTVPLGGQPDHLALDPASGTLYVADGASGTVTMISTAACNAARRTGCGKVRRFRTYPPPSRIGAGLPTSDDMAVNARTRTLYILNRGTPATVAVISMAGCNAGTTRGCRGRPALLRLPGPAGALAVNPRTNTLYAAHEALPVSHSQLYVINASSCDAANLHGCAAAPVYPVPRHNPILGMAVDPATDTLYLGGPAQLLVLDGRTCGAGDVRGCTTVLGAAPVDGVAGHITVAQASGAVYITSTDSGAVTVINSGTCSALRTAGCRGPVRAASGGPLPSGAAADPASGTVYVTDGSAAVTMIRAAACGGASVSGCGQAPAGFPVGTTPAAPLIDAATRTLYVLNTRAGSISLISTAACNAASTAGCPRRSPAGTGPMAWTQFRNLSYTCDPGSYSGLPAGPFTRVSVRVAAGSADGLRWSVWARKAGIRPWAIEKGGLVLNGRWYSLCDESVSGRSGASIQLAGVGTRAVTYGYIQHPQRVAISLRSQGRPLPLQSVVQLPGTTIFVSRLPHWACFYHQLTLAAHAVVGPAWSGTTQLTLGPCVVQRPSYVLSTTGNWGPGPARG
jgi:DNA-binding beta-propeller fold protein YncE